MQFSTMTVLLAVAAGQALAGTCASPTRRGTAGLTTTGSMMGRRQNGSFDSFTDGSDSEIFNNEGAACSVGSQDGTCDQFGRCVQFIPPNRGNVLNQGETVPECTA